MKKIFIAATSQNDGKTTIALGLILNLKEHFPNIGFIKPIGQRYLLEEGIKVDEDSVLIEKVCNFTIPLKDLNPIAVEVAAKAGAKVIWMPTLSSVVDTEKRLADPNYPLTTAAKYPTNGISLIDLHGKILPDMIGILEIIKDHGIVLATGHISVPEIYAIVTQAKYMKVKVSVSHPLTTGAGSTLTIGQQQELVNKGAYIEHCFNACLPPELATSTQVMAEHIKAVGVENCILSTDFGQYNNPTPPEGFRMMIANMLMAGLSPKELEILVKKNPARLLELD